MDNFDVKSVIKMAIGGAVVGALYGIILDFMGTGDYTDKLKTPLWDAVRGGIIGAGAAVIDELILSRFIN